MTLSLASPRAVVSPTLLRAARAGSTEAFGRLFEACRPYLLLVADQELRPPLQAKVEASDVVQETFLEAQRDFRHFRGQSEAQLLGWLRGILLHNLADLGRRFEASCRRLSQEVPLSDRGYAVAPSGGALADGQTACEQLIAREERLALVAALERLPPSYRRVLQLRYDERQSFAEIGTSLQRSPEAARKLWCRALEQLRHHLESYRDV